MDRMIPAGLDGKNRDQGTEDRGRKKKVLGVGCWVLNDGLHIKVLGVGC